MLGWLRGPNCSITSLDVEFACSGGVGIGPKPKYVQLRTQFLQNIHNV